MTDFSMVSGDNRTLELTIVDPLGVAVDITAATIVWRAGRTPQGVAIIEKPGTVQPATGRFNVLLVPLDTTLLAGVFYHWAVVTAGGVVSTVDFGLFVIHPATSGASAEQFKARFPEFSAVSDVLVSMVLEEAASNTSWVEKDRIPAQLYLTAHLLALQGEPQRTAAGAGGAGQSGLTGPMKRRKVGDVEVEYAGSGSGQSGGSGMGVVDTALLSTPYGRQYIVIRNRNFSGIMAV